MTQKPQIDLEEVRVAAQAVANKHPKRVNRRGLLWIYRPFGGKGFEAECFLGHILTEVGLTPLDFKGECRGIRMAYDKNPDQFSEEAWEWLEGLQILSDKQDPERAWSKGWKAVLKEYESSHQMT